MTRHLIFLTALLLSSSLFAEGEVKHKLSKQEIKEARIRNAPKKNRVWSLEIAMLKYQQKIHPGNSIRGPGGRVSVGYGMIGTRFLFLGDINLYFGPFGTSYSTVQYDYLGSGASLTVGSTFDGSSIRSSGTGFGLLGGVGYQEFQGRVYGRHDSDEPVPASTAGIVTTYGNRVASADINLGLFLSWLKSQRPDTYDTEFLVTRNEGLILSMQVSMPVWSRFRAQYQELDAKQVPNKRVQSGTIEGYKLILSLRAFLGS